jgi:glycosyltransferase involved in cell wall biosynthesis
MGTPNILFTGCMTYWPNHDAVMFFIDEVLPKIADGCRDVLFRVIGTGAEALQISNRPNISVIGYVDNLGPYYAGCDVFVCPLRTGTGIKNKMLDAMASGCAIVSTSVGAEGLPVVHGRDLFIANTPGEFAAATLLLLKDCSLRIQLGANARDNAERNFSMEAVARHLQHILPINPVHNSSLDN